MNFVNRIATFGRLKVVDFRKELSRIVPWTIEHALFVGGFACMAFGAWMVWHPLGPIVGGWFAVKIALLISQERR